MALFADDLDNDLTAARAHVEIDDDDLLPGAQFELAVRERYGQRRSK